MAIPTIDGIFSNQDQILVTLYTENSKIMKLESMGKSPQLTTLAAERDGGLVVFVDLPLMVDLQCFMESCITTQPIIQMELGNIIQAKDLR